MFCRTFVNRSAAISFIYTVRPPSCRSGLIVHSKTAWAYVLFLTTYLLPTSTWPIIILNVDQTDLSGSQTIFRFPFFGQSEQKWKIQLSCLFIFCIKNLHFACKWQLFFSFFGHFDQKTKLEKWNEPDNNS